jgi:DNA-binding MarR family transcriptional regulator
MPKDLRKLEEEIAYITGAFAEEEEAFLRMAEASGLTARHMHHLDVIAALGNPTPSEIAVRQDLTKPSVTALISRLSALGFIRKTKSDVDRREYHVHLTEKGIAFERTHAAVHRRLAGVFAAALSAGERVRLVRLLEKIRGATRRRGRSAGRAPARGGGSTGGGRTRRG